MASRSTFGFRAKHAERDDRPPNTQVGLPRRGSITSNISNTPKMPAPSSSSFFARSKKVKADASSSKLPGPPGIPVSRENVTASLSSSQGGPASSIGQDTGRGMGSGSLSGNTTVQVSKSGKTRNVLRRKAPMSDSRSGYTRTESSASSYDPPPARLGKDTKHTPEGYRGVDPFANSVLGITAPSVPSSATAPAVGGLGPSFEFDTSSSRMARFNNRKAPSSSPNPSLPPPTPNYAHDSESSARRSESPGAFSRTSTPTSMSSQSPGVATPYKVPMRVAPQRQKSPVRAVPGRSRPPVALETRRGRGLESSSQGLTAVRESGTSSSSSSTVKASGSREDSTKTPLSNRSSPRPFSPPSRSSSQRQVVPSPSAFSRGQTTPSPTMDQRPAMTTRLPKTSAEISTVMRRVDQPVRTKPPPVRPSREGVPTLILSEEDKMSLVGGLPHPELAPLGRSTSGASSVAGQRSRVTSPNPAVDAPRTREQPPLDTNISTTRTARDPSPQSLAAGKTSSRFGFLRRNKSPEKVERAAKKGPAAGTGHEGYSKNARRGRSGSFSTSASRGRSTSSTSIGRTPSSRKSSLTSQNEGEMDDFYRNRLEPKKIIGGGQPGSAHGSDLNLNEEPQNLAGISTRHAEHAKNDTASKTRQFRTEVLTLEPHQAHALRHVGRIVPHRDHSAQGNSQNELHEDYSASEDTAPTLATRRSLHRSQLFTGIEPLRIPAPIDTRATAMSPAMDSQNTYQSSVPQSDTTVPLSDDISEGHEGNWLNSRNHDKPTKSPKRWAFFHRSQASPRKAAVPAAPKSNNDPAIRELRAQVATVPEAQTVAFYELMNQSEQDDLGPSRTTSRAEDVNPHYETQTAPSETEAQRFSPIETRKNASMLLPSPPTLNQEFAVPAVASSLSNDPPPQLPSIPAIAPSDAPTALPEPRKPRLQQVGRIPRVVSKRDRTHKPPPQSFSRPRPYAPRQEPSIPTPTTTAPSPLATGDRPVLEVQTEQIPSDPWGALESAKPASAPVTSIVDSTRRSNSGNEFLSFPSRIGSSVSAATSSSGLLSFADATAVIPRATVAPTEEEEWNEYNDFLDIMESPAPLSSTKGNPYDKAVKKRSGSIPAPLEVRKAPGSSSSGDSTTKPHGSTYPPATPPTRRLPSPPKKFKRSSPLKPSKNITTGDDDRKKQKDVKSSTGHKRSSSRYSNSSIESEADSLAGQENVAMAKVHVPGHLRLELLTISKLLSFDRVLFSPAHAEISSNRKNRVLVLDGLGIDDWAFYCAQEYPDAQISNLSPIPRTVNSPNYEHHHYPSLDGPFPFPQNFFTAAVMRFPAATSEEAYANVIKEFRRVLCPGSYLEIAVIDIDMVKMGQTTRRALRGLKQRKQIAEPQTSLKPLSDNIQKMLGGRAFGNMKQCMLEIPVAGSPSSSRVRSFNEKMELIDEMPRDEGDRTKHLPEIGRWWYSRCYEQGPQLPNTTTSPSSIWDSKEVLTECEIMETGFKMLLCYAQKPNNKRRTLSL